MTEYASTAAELEMLPVGCIIARLDSSGVPLDVWTRRTSGWERTGALMFPLSSEQLAGRLHGGEPFTILHRPEGGGTYALTEAESMLVAVAVQHVPTINPLNSEVRGCRCDGGETYMNPRAWAFHMVKAIREAQVPAEPAALPSREVIIPAVVRALRDVSLASRGHAGDEEAALWVADAVLALPSRTEAEIKVEACREMLNVILPRFDIRAAAEEHIQRLSAQIQTEGDR